MPHSIKQELAKTVAERYKLARNKKDKTKILDEFCANTKFNRKYAIDKIKNLNKGENVFLNYKRRGRKKIYSDESTKLLLEIWESYDRVCGERLHPYLPECIKKLNSLNQIKYSKKVQKEVLRMSCSKVKRTIVSERKENDRVIISTTKPGKMLKKDIPIQTKSWDEKRIGFCEIDLVAHCGGSMGGDFINTLQFVDIKTGWTERTAVLTKNKKVVLDGIRRIKKTLPFRLNGIDSDNGSEFINKELLEYCESEGIVFTRSRPYMKKDNAHIEQKNWPMVRKLIGYGRYCTREQLDFINDLYNNELRLYINFLQPNLKLIEKFRNKSKWVKKYDKAKTPYQRVLEAEDVDENIKNTLREIYNKLDPRELLDKIKEKIQKIHNSLQSGIIMN